MNKANPDRFKTRRIRQPRPGARQPLDTGCRNLLDCLSEERQDQGQKLSFDGQRGFLIRKRLRHRATNSRGEGARQAGTFSCGLTHQTQERSERHPKPCYWRLALVCQVGTSNTSGARAWLFATAITAKGLWPVGSTSNTGCG